MQSAWREAGQNTLLPNKKLAAVTTGAALGKRGDSTATLFGSLTVALLGKKQVRVCGRRGREHATHAHA